MLLKPDLSLEREQGGVVCGIDEAGRGPWAGPVVAAAVIWKDMSVVAEAVNDSKKLKKSQREILFEIITTQAHIGVGQSEVGEIDRLNILGATRLAMQRAYAALAVQADCALIDGNQPPQLPCRTIPIVKGDARSLSIAAASIIAKVTRDRLMEALGREYPGYGFERHAGYGTPQHQEALDRLGVCPAHRRSFAPIRQRLEHIAVA